MSEKKFFLPWDDKSKGIFAPDDIEGRKTEAERRGALRKKNQGGPNHKARKNRNANGTVVIKLENNLNGKYSEGDAFALRLIQWGLVFVLVFSPLFKAGVPEGARLIIQLTVLALAGVWVLMKHKPAPDPLLQRAVLWPGRLFLALFGLIVFQVLPLPLFLVRLLSPRSVAFRAEFSPGFAGTKFTAISLMPGHTLRIGLELLTWFLIGFLVIRTVTRRKQIFRLMYAVVGMGVFQAFYGFFELLNPHPRLLFFKKMFYSEDLTGTFVNRNHLSGYLEMAIPLAVALILARTELLNPEKLSWRKRLLRISEQRHSRTLLLGLGTVLMIAAVISSHSRSGIGIVILGLLLFMGLSLSYTGDQWERQRRIKTVFRYVTGAAAFLALYIGIDAAIQRFSVDRLLAEQRPVFWAQTLEMSGDFPVFGSGLGTFPHLYAAYDSSGFAMDIIHAHNDHLEYLSELGWLGGLLLLGGILWLLVEAFRMWRQRRNPEVKALALGAMIAGAAMLLHGITDFNLHIPANLALFAVVLPLAVVASFYQASRHQDNAEIRKQGGQLRLTFPESGRRGLRIAGVVGLGLAALTAILSFTGRAMGTAAAGIADTDRRIRALERAGWAWPLDERIERELGRAHLEQALLGIEDGAVREGETARALDHLSRALALNPADFESLFALARLEHMRGFLTGEAGGRPVRPDSEALFRKAARLAGPRPRMLRELGMEMLSRWPSLDEEDRTFVRDILRRSVRHANGDELLTLLSFWEMNSGDYDLIADILPRTRHGLRTYARFLGERSLDAGVRRRALASAEAMDFEEAEKIFRQAEYDEMYGRAREAEEGYTRVLSLLDRLRLYQGLTGEEKIDEEAGLSMRKTARLKRARMGLRQGRGFKAVEKDLDRYLELEDRRGNLDDLEKELERWHVLPGGTGLRYGAIPVSASAGDKGGADAGADELDLLTFQLGFLLKRNRFREVIDVGRRLEGGFVAVPRDRKAVWAKVQRLIGEACRRSDFLYDAHAAYQKALDAEPDDLATLLCMREAYRRASDDKKLTELEKTIAGLLTPRDLDLGGREIARRGGWSRDLVLDGGEKAMEIRFTQREERAGGALPSPALVSVFFNRRVVFEDYVPGGIVRFEAESRPGENRLEIRAVNRAVRIEGIGWQDVRVGGNEAPY